MGGYVRRLTERVIDQKARIEALEAEVARLREANAAQAEIIALQRSTALQREDPYETAPDFLLKATRTWSGG